MKPFLHVLIVFFFAFRSLSVISQNPIDSLRKEISKGLADTALANSYLSLSEAFASVSGDSMEFYTKKALDFIEANDQKIGKEEYKVFQRIKAGALNNLGYAEATKGNMEKAFGAYEKSLKLYEELKIP